MLIEEINKYSLQGWDITIKAGGQHFVKYMTKEDLNDPDKNGTYYVYLYYGDSNGPHKSGTKQGNGSGFTLEQAWKNAVDNIQFVNFKDKLLEGLKNLSGKAARNVDEV
jgi:hypothetical protein